MLIKMRQVPILGPCRSFIFGYIPYDALMEPYLIEEFHVLAIVAIICFFRILCCYQLSVQKNSIIVFKITVTRCFNWYSLSNTNISMISNISLLRKILKRYYTSIFHIQREHITRMVLIAYLLSTKPILFLDRSTKER